MAAGAGRASVAPIARALAFHHRAPLRLTLILDGVAAAAFATTVLVLELRGDRRGPDDGFFSDPLPAILALTALVAAITAGAVAARALTREPLQTDRGRWATWLGLAFAASFPVLWALTLALGLDAGWAEPAVPLQMLAVLGAVGLGATAHEPGRRGLLLIPFVIGVAALAFFLGDLIVPYA